MSTRSRMGQSQVEAKFLNVTRFFDSLWGGSLVRALTGVTFEVRRGEVFGLLGPSGSGKSTAIKLLAGDLRPMEGRVEVFGRSPRRGSVRARIGYLPQTPANGGLRPEGGVFGFIRGLFGRQNHTARRSKIVGDTSGLERRSVLRQVLVKNPELLLLDEPFAGLDPAGCGQMQDFIQKMARQGRTVILTGSSLAYAKDVCHRLAVFSRGRIEAIGTLPELLSTGDSLRCLSEVLPPTTAERVLDTIRQDLAIAARSPSPTEPRLEPLASLLPGEPSAAEAILAPLARTMPASKPVTESKDKVDHNLLAALARSAPEDSPAPPKGES